MPPGAVLFCMVSAPPLPVVNQTVFRLMVTLIGELPVLLE
jgi:hypothetical protein